MEEMSKFLVSEIFIDTNTKQPESFSKNGETSECGSCCVLELVYSR